MPKVRFKEKARAFAKEWGWDGVIWDGSHGDYETYTPGIINDYSEVMPLTPPFDNIARIIVADKSGARWQDPEIGEKYGDARDWFMPRNELNGRVIPNLEDYYD